MASLDIMLDVQGNDDVTELVNNLNKLEAQTKKMYKAFANGNITMREAKGSFKALAGGTNEYTQSMDRLIDSLNSQKVAQDKAADLKNYLNSQKFAVKALKERIKANEDAEKAEERRNKKLDLDAEKARRRYDPIYAATKKYEQALEDMRMAQARAGMSQEAASVATEGLTKDYQQFVAAIKTGNMALIDGGNQFGAFGQKVYGARRRVQKFGSSVGQQVGYQVQDFFVQIQSGTDVMVALGQQGSQLAGVFGTKGALFGAVIAIGTAIGGIAIAAYKSMQGLEDLKDSLDELASAQSSLKEILNLLEQSPVQIAENFTMAIGELQRYLKILAEAEMRVIRGKAETTMSSARPFLKTRLGLGLSEKQIAAEFGIAGARSFMDQVKGFEIGELGAYTDEQLRLLEEYQRLSKEVLNATDPKQAADAFLGLEEVLKKLGVATEDLPEGFVTARDEFVKFALEYDRASATILKVDKALAKGIQNSTEETDKLRKRIQDDRLKAERRALDAIEAARKKRRDSARKEDQKDLNKLSETEKLRRRLQERSTQIIQAAEKRNRDRRRKEEEEAARLRAREETRIQEEESRRRIKNITERVKKDAIPPFDPRALGFDKIEAEAYKLQNGLESSSIDFEKRRTDRLMREYAKVGKARIAYNKTVAEEQAERDQETLKRQKAAEESLTRLQNGRLYASRAYNSEIIQASQERTEEELAAQQKFLEGIQEALQEGQKLSELDMKSPYDSALLSAKELAELMEISLSEALTIINAIEQAKTGPVSGGRGRTLPTASDILMMGMGGEYIPSDKKDKPSGKSDFEKVQDYIKGLSDQASKEKQLVGIFDEQRDLMGSLIDARQKYGDIATDSQMKTIEGYIKETHALQQQQKALDEAKQKQEELANDIAGSMGDAFISIVDGTKSVKDAFRDMASYIIRRLYEILVVEQMVQSISSAIGGAMAGPVQGPPAPSVNANGNVFSRGSLVPYANGGIVGSPMYFPMSGGRTGLMGEAGPEAIMPLKRGKNGKLGVQADGGGDNIVINQSFNFAANGDDSVKRIIAQQAPKIAQMTQQQIMDSRRRGGQMKAVFG